MATLKDDYSDAVYNGKRTFKVTQSNGTVQTGVNIEDTTTYISGDYFGASDINATNAQVNGLGSVKKITLALGNWSSETTTVNGTAYYTNVVSGLTIFADNPVIGIGAAGTLPTKTEVADYACINAAIADVSGGTITFYAEDKPSGAVVVLAKGVA